MSDLVERLNAVEIEMVVMGHDRPVRMMQPDPLCREAAARITALEARVREGEERERVLRGVYQIAVRELGEAQVKRGDAERENRALREGLAPFSDHGRKYDDFHADSYVVIEVRVGDLHNARALTAPAQRAEMEG